MHCTLLGVAKTLLSIWSTTSKCRGTNHDIRNFVPIIDGLLQQVKVPSEIRRTPRGISDQKHWKGKIDYCQ